MAIGTFLYPAITDKLGSAADSAKLNSNNTFTGNNTFNNPVVVPNPTANNQATNKGYVDGLLSKDITQEQLAPFKLGNTPVYMKYLNETITITNTTATAIPNCPRIDILLSHSLTIDNHYLLPWFKSSVNVRVLLENNVIKIEADNGTWINNIKGMIYYTKA